MNVFDRCLMHNAINALPQEIDPEYCASTLIVDVVRHIGIPKPHPLIKVGASMDWRLGDEMGVDYQMRRVIRNCHPFYPSFLQQYGQFFRLRL